MRTLFNFLLGHRNPLGFIFNCRTEYAEPHQKSIPPATGSYQDQKKSRWLAPRLYFDSKVLS
jgi:hypothetical protein